MRAATVFGVASHPLEVDIVLLLLRLVAGCAFLQHGWPLIQHPTTWATQMGIPSVFQVLAAVSQFFGAIAWILGLVTRLASLGIFVTMAVAVATHVFIFGDPFVHPTGGRSFELAAIYLLISLLLIVAGPGRFSLDARIFGKKP